MHGIIKYCLITLAQFCLQSAISRETIQNHVVSFSFLRTHEQLTWLFFLFFFHRKPHQRISSKWSTHHTQMMFLSQELSIQHIFWLSGTPFKLPLPAIYILMQHFRYKEVHDGGWLLRFCPSPAVTLPGALIQMILLHLCSCEQQHCSTQLRALHRMWPLLSVIHERSQFGALPQRITIHLATVNTETYSAGA